MKTLKLKTAEKKNLVNLLLRLGLAIVFLYAAISTLHKPADWAAFFPNFLTNFVSIAVGLKILAIYEIILAVWLFSGKYIKFASLLCALTLAGIILINLGQLIVTFRDIGLFFTALALFFTDDQ